MSIELRPYQQECVSLVLDEYKRNPHGKSLIVIPTGGGKTIVFSAVIDSLAREYGLNALIIAHRDELLTQAADKYRMIRPNAIIGKVGSGIHQYGGEVTVASIATISRPEHLKRLKAIGYGIIIIDEAHHQAAVGYQRVLEALPDAFALSVTATPKRLDKKQISEKPPLFQTTIIEMIRQGYLCDMKAIAIRTEVSLDEIRTTAGDFNEHDLDLAVNTPTRNKRVVNAYQEHTPNKRAVCFAVTIAHAKALAYEFNDAGIHAAVIEGNTPIEERQRLYKAFHHGDVKILCNVMVLTEGWDEPLCEVAIMARPTQSESLYIQQAGRILRLAPGKKVATLLDITDNCLKHRIAPQNFKRVIHQNVKPDETLLDSLAREADEQADKEAEVKRALIRKLNDRREKDVSVNLFGLPEWQERNDGMFVMEVGVEKHRVALVPNKNTDGNYDVWARLAPTFEAQQWLRSQPLDWAMQAAEKRAQMLLSGEAKLVDKHAAWRSEPPSEGQFKMLKWYRIPTWDGMTKGEAADLITAHKEKLEARKAEKEARKAEKMKEQAEAVPAGNLNGDRAFRMMR